MITTEPITECAICYHVGPCTDDGEALICTDRAACQARCDAVVDRLYSEFSAQAQPPDDEEEPSDEPPPPATMDEVVEAAYARRNIPLEGEERYTHGAAYARERATATEEPNADVNWSEGPAMEAT